MSAGSLLLALALQAGGRAPESPRYPWRIVPVDAVYGHLAEGAFQEPLGVCFEPAARELFVADSRNGLIGIFDAERTPLFTFGGPALMIEPRAVLAEEDGAIFVLDALQTELRAFDYRGEPAASLRFERPAELGLPGPVRIGAFARDERHWYLGDLDAKGVLVFHDERRFVRALAPSKRAGKLAAISDLALSPAGLLAVSDMQSVPALHVYDGSGELVAAFGERDVGLGDFTAAAAVAFDEQGFLYAVDLLKHDVKVFTVHGEFVARFGGWFSPETRGRSPGELLYPMDIAVDPRGPIYVAERYGQRVQVFQREPLPPQQR